MPGRDQPDLDHIEALSAHLDALSEVGDAPRPMSTGRLPDDLLETAQAVQTASRPRGLTRRFTDRLEEDLMDLAALDRPLTRTDPASPRRRVPAPLRLPHPPAPGTPHRASRIREIMELLGLTAVIALLFGQVMGMGGNLAFWQDATPVPAESTPASGLLRVDAGRSGAYADPGPTGIPTLRWVARNAVDRPFLSQPIVFDDTLFVADPVSGQVAMVDSDGLLTPRVVLPTVTTYLADNGTIVVATGVGDKGTISAHGAGYLTERWRVETGVSAGALGYDGERVFMVDTLGHLTAIDVRGTGTVWGVDLRVGRLDTIFQPPFGVMNDPSPAVANGMVVVGTPGGGVRAFSATDGSARWAIDLPEEIVGAPAIVDGTVFIASRETNIAGTIGAGHVYALDAETGSQRWSYATVGWSRPMSKAANVIPVDLLVLTADGQRVYVNGDSESGDAITALDAATGEVDWSVGFGVASGAAPVVSGDTLYATRPDGRVYGLDAATGDRRFRLDAGALDLRSPAILGDLLLVVTADGRVIALGDALPTGDSSATTSPAGVADDDVSGLAPCVGPRLRPDPLPTGEPTASLVPSGPTGGEGSGAIVRSEIPTEPSTDAAALGAMLDTFRAMRACDRPGKESELGGFFTDDYYRRVARDYPDIDPAELPWVAAVPYTLETIKATDLPNPVVLADGRVALLLWQEQWREGQLVVFAPTGSTWLIDEVVRVTSEPDQPMG